MAFNQQIAEEIGLYLQAKNISFTTKKMFMGVCFMVDDKMLCGLHIDKASEQDVLLVRLSENDYDKNLNATGCKPMVMGKKTMKNFLFVDDSGFAQLTELYRWIDLCLTYNPEAKRSKK